MKDYVEFKSKIHEQSFMHKDQVIISDASRSLNWKEFTRLVENFRRILSSEINSSSKICFYAERNIESVAVMLACFLDKKCFVPIDPDQPQERIKSMLATIGSESIFKPSEERFISTIQVKDFFSKDVDLNDICYVLFTSGSSGNPKAVKITYKNLLNTINWGLKQFEWLDSDVIGIPTKFSFDISLFDVFTSLVRSKKMHIFAEVANPVLFHEECNFAKVTSIFTTPSLFVMLNRHKLFDRLKLRRIISGGDFFPTKDLLEILNNNPSLQIYNIWGPTETTIINTCHLVTKSDVDLLQEKNLVSVGKSSAQMPIFIADSENESEIIEIPTGKTGEVVVLGESVSPGYLNYGDSSGSDSGFKQFRGIQAYRTGDIGFIDSNHDLFIVGRNKQFIKYQGFRIDPREVEFIADKYRGIDKSVLTLKTNESNEPALVMYFACHQKIDISKFKANLRNNLPKYMIPKYVIEIPTIPLSFNGKVDRKAVDKLEVSSFTSRT